MFGKIIIKEWRDNWLLLSLALLVLAIFIVLGLAGPRMVSAGLAGILVLIVLPVTGLLLGAGAFGAEFRDNAWTYLFSRPVRKSTIWILKYLALLSFLAAAFLILNLAVALLPGLRGVLKDFYAPSFFSNMVTYGLAVFLAFTISYSLSILSEKSLIIFAASAVIGGLLIWLHSHYVRFLAERYVFEGFFPAFGLFIGASFILASILTLTRIDFSRQAKKVLSLASLVLLFLAVSVAMATLIISRGNPFAKPRIEYWESSKIQGNVYLETQARRVIRYDSKEDRVCTMPAGISEANFEFSSAGGKIGLAKTERGFMGYWKSEAVAANYDGSGWVTLARFYGKDSAFNGWTLEGNVLISSGGRQAAFVASPPGLDRAKNPARLFWMNMDGSDLRDKPLDFYRKGSISLLSWLEEQQSLVLRIVETRMHSLTAKIIKLNLDTGDVRTLETTYPQPSNYEWLPFSCLSPDKRFLITRLWDQARNKENAVLLDLASFETRELAVDVPLFVWAMAWTRQGDRLAMRGSRDGSLWVYTLADGSLKKVWEHADRHSGFSFDWLGDGRLIIAGLGKDTVGRLAILSQDFTSTKEVKIPDQFLKSAQEDFFGAGGIWYGLRAAEDRVLVMSKTEVWRLDLKTEGWKKIY
jgi:hypothetical protein